MIATIRGKLVEATPVTALIEAGGLGYELHIPVTTSEKLPTVGETVFLLTHAIYREDSATLYGFASRDEKLMFRLLCEKVSGIGPKTAISILSKLSTRSLRSAIATGDVASLSKCPGIGKKTAERLIVELRESLGAIGGGVPIATTGPIGDGSESIPADQPPADSPHQAVTDAITALIELGYKAPVAEKTVTDARKRLGPDANVQELIKASLR